MKAARYLFLAVLVAGLPAFRAAATKPADSEPLRAAPLGPIVEAPDGKSEMELVRFDEGVTARLQTLAPEETLRVDDWPVSPGVRRPVILSRFDVYAPDARIVRIVNGLEVDLPRSPLAFFKGATADGDESARVVTWVDPSLGVRGGLVFGPDGMVEIEPDPDPKAGTRLCVLTSEARSAAESARPTWSCAQGEGDTAYFSVPDTRAPAAEADKVVVPEGMASLATTPTKTAVIAFDTDDEWVTYRWAGSTANTINHLATLIASMTIIYERDAGAAMNQGVKILQGYSIIRATSAEDPYPNTYGQVSQTKLDDLKAYWEMYYPRTVVQRALVALISGKQLNGPTNYASGRAWVGGLCNGNGYSVDQLITSMNLIAYDMLILAHEVGHNFGSPHTHCYSDPKPDTCYALEPGCFAGTPSCPASATYNGVTTTGTLMSYCHTLDLGGGTYCSYPPNQNVFHPTSVLSYLLPNINAPSSSCLKTLSGGVVPSGPSSIAISPTSGPLAGGQTVTVTGGGFAAGTTVSFVELPSNNIFGGSPNSKVLSSISVLNANTITAVTPSATNTGLVDVVVMNADQQTATLRSGFTYSSAPPAPTVTAISPNTGSTAGGTRVTITGTGFVSTPTTPSVVIGSANATAEVFVNATTLTAIVPAHAAGLANVVVTNPDAQSGTLTNGYAYLPAPSASRYYVLTPCRLFDTRNTTIVAANETRLFDVSGLCGVHNAAIALTVNATVTGSGAAGELRIFPGNGLSPNPPASALFYAAGKTRANNDTIRLSTDGTATLKVQNVSAGAVHFILDVSGYYAP